MTETNLAQTIEAVSAETAYDTNIKFLLADKQILARILKYTIKEFQDMTIDEIMNSIGDDIEVAAVPVDPGLTNLGRVKESNTEDSVPGEGKTFFDIRFSAYSREAEMRFLINVEAQKASTPGRLGYHLENRIVFYLARMISAQKQTEFYNSDYDKLKKVRSIWICMDGRRDGDSIEEIHLVHRFVFGTKEIPRDVDLLQGIIINVRSGKNVKASENILISMLERLLSRMDTEEKKRILEKEYGMVMTIELEGRLQNMCNLSENIMEEGIEQGIEQGKLLTLISLVEQGLLQGSDAAKQLDITEEEFRQKMCESNVSNDQ